MRVGVGAALVSMLSRVCSMSGWRALQVVVFSSGVLLVVWGRACVVASWQVTVRRRRRRVGSALVVVGMGRIVS